ncbi:amino acid ABC transporter substrate-binding protein (PAAT family) [Actinocorallia herbida]|uniref:Amino acid ABC transporter substrate-binding protein (PAAT family) n=1 Tax=Actinocorallia herbida TaxID=58109 RepID=A0A3N1CQ74_9ACTN|nr:glutamate ABC transporter substrate-binding protein [Actinocorallia herbida]ROO83442.1 amino acid ABC transporter substrate-binding protein (PAAT family) [Actinocorallia herbida]
MSTPRETEIRRRRKRGRTMGGGLRRLLAPVLAGALALALAGCAEEEPKGIEGRKTLRIGVKFDQPGIGQQTEDGEFEGFDVDVARYVAAYLGAAPDFVSITSGDRERLLRERKVDLVVASYSITPDRRLQVNFAGPYIIGHQDIMVREDDADIHSVHDLRGKRLCKAGGSISWKRVTVELGIRAKLVPATTYGECVEMLEAGMLDALTTDDVILAGFALRRPEAFRLVKAKFTDEKYGIGLHKDDIGGCEAVNRALIAMYQDGTAEKLLARWFQPAGLETTGHVPQFEGCS